MSNDDVLRSWKDGGTDEVPASPAGDITLTGADVSGGLRASTHGVETLGCCDGTYSYISVCSDLC